jgi:hypothetical protein
MGSTWKMQSLDDFMESLIHEQTKIIQIEALKNSQPHALTTQGSSKKNKQKNKGKKDQENKKEGKKNSIDENSSSKASKGNKEKTKCSYCNMGFHIESSYMKKTIHIMAQTLEKHQFESCIPDNERKNPSSKRVNGHALLSISYSPNSWVLDSGDHITWSHQIDFSHTWRLVPDNRSSWEMILP